MTIIKRSSLKAKKTAQIRHEQFAASIMQQKIWNHLIDYLYANHTNYFTKSLNKVLIKNARLQGINLNTTAMLVTYKGEWSLDATIATTKSNSTKPNRKYLEYLSLSPELNQEFDLLLEEDKEVKYERNMVRIYINNILNQVGSPYQLYETMPEILHIELEKFVPKQDFDPGIPGTKIVNIKNEKLNALIYQRVMRNLLLQELEES